MSRSRGLLIDTTKCVGCRECERACAATYHLPEEEAKDLSATHYTVVKSYNDDQTFVRRLCMHCNQPTCVSACLVGAFTKTETGAVLYDESKCIGCRYCMQACPFEIPRYEWGSLTPRIQKCQMCYDRVAAGEKTACAEACQFDATVFGYRDDLIKEAGGGSTRTRASMSTTSTGSRRQGAPRSCFSLPSPSNNSDSR
jgi:formate dehydrogenase iron-sulfur subunit